MYVQSWCLFPREFEFIVLKDIICGYRTCLELIYSRFITLRRVALAALGGANCVS